jgi:hypothetical protein
MKNPVGLTVIILFALLLLLSWPVNLVRFIQCDFKAPYKAEVIRGIGIPIVPVGIVAAYLPLGK